MQALVDFYHREPARVHGIVAAALVAIAAAVGFIIDVDTAGGIAAALVPLVVGELTRRQVFSPASVEQITDYDADGAAASLDEGPDEVHPEAEVRDGELA